MKYLFLIPAVIWLTFIFGVNNTFACHVMTDAEREASARRYAFLEQASDDGYRCDVVVSFNGSSCDRATYICTKYNVVTYDAERISDLSLKGTRSIGNSVRSLYYPYYNSPFIYLNNPPDGTIKLSLMSALDTYVPKPAFNQKNGWVVESENGKITVDGNRQNHLFYELSINNISLNRNGRNFSSKEDVVSFLQDSDFLTKLGFSEEEKKNSLDYFVTKLQTAPERNFYYLTVLDETSIANISTLAISPKPENILMKYFVVYPTNVTVATTGDFVFPVQTKDDSKSFTVDVTGEFLVDSSMVVFWNK